MIQTTTISIFIICLVGLTTSQRPTYVREPVRYPDVAPRFRVSTSTETVELGNRNGVPTSTERLPIDARGNADVVNQIKNWPDHLKPFWYLNAQHIENARAQSVPAAGQEQQLQQANVGSRSSFLS